MEKERITTYDPKKNKSIKAGYIENNIFIKEVSGRHFFRKFQAYGIQEDVIQKLIERKIKKIRIISYTLTYDSSIKDWVNGHVLIRDFGNGLQRFLPIHYMKKTQRK